VQSGAGTGASISDAEYKTAGAQIAKTAKDTIKGADIVLCVQGNNTIKDAKGAIVIGMLMGETPALSPKELATAKINAMAMEFIPRISRAQSMDVLSSQSNLAGYKAVLDAASEFGRAFPMMMTAAGTVPPAKVFVMGAGVAGLQAIATARRLGAVVTATDVRPAAKEQVESLGASFVAVEDDEFKQAETAGGYAKQMSAAYQKKQAALVAEHIQKQDIVITTALIPGRPAPKLISEPMVKSMKTGAVVVDLATITGGNCALSEKDKTAHKHGVTIIGHTNTPSRLSADSSALYARNILNLLKLIIKDGTLEIDESDEIIQGITLTKDGKIVHPRLKPVKKPAAKKSTTKTTKTKTTKTKNTATKKKGA